METFCQDTIELLYKVQLKVKLNKNRVQFVSTETMSNPMMPASTVIPMVFGSAAMGGLAGGVVGGAVGTAVVYSTGNQPVGQLVLQPKLLNVITFNVIIRLM